MKKDWLAGVDLGGTTIKMAFTDLNGDIIRKWEIPTDTSEQGKNITKDIARSIDEKLAELQENKGRLAGIGMGAPGFINMETGFIYQAVNIGWKDFPLKDRLEKETGLPVTVDNDANIAAIGEMWKGAGDGADNLLAVTLGTGVGGGIIAYGEILHGTNGMAGEIGHITSIPEGGAPCNCGKTGCLETIASATGIVRIARERLAEADSGSQLAERTAAGNPLTSRDVFAAAQAGDPFAAEVVDEVTFHLGLALSNLANAINPSKIVIGGGVSKAGAALIDPLEKHFKRFALPRVYEGAEIAAATLGNDAGVIGGAFLAKTNRK